MPTTTHNDDDFLTLDELLKLAVEDQARHESDLAYDRYARLMVWAERRWGSDTRKLNAVLRRAERRYF